MGIADKTYYLDENDQVTTDAEKAAFVLINEGQEVPKEMADKYGIGKVTPTEGTADTVEEKSETPKENKAEKPSKNKGAK